jgi:hypothetical protein
VSPVTRSRTRSCSGRRWCSTRPRGRRAWRSLAGWRRRRRSSLAGEDASTTSGCQDSRIERGRVARAVFRPEQVTEVKAIACELPVIYGLLLGRFTRTELHRLVIERGVTDASASTIWRWLHDDALKPWQQRSWLFVRDPAFGERRGGCSTGSWLNQIELWRPLPPDRPAVRLDRHARRPGRRARQDQRARAAACPSGVTDRSRAAP